MLGTGPVIRNRASSSCRHPPLPLTHRCVIAVIITAGFGWAFLRGQGAQAFLLGTGATIVGYFLYGGLSFGLTEFLKRRFVELAGPDLAALYPIPILLGAR